MPTPPLLFMTSNGELIGEVSNYATADSVLSEMHRVLLLHPEYDRPLPDERTARSTIQRAEIAIDLGDYDGARAILTPDTSSKAHYLLGRLARFRRDWKEMDEQMRAVVDPDLQDDVRMERAYRSWFEGDFGRLEADLRGFPETSKRYTEARYHLGLALHHQGKQDEAMRTWAETVKSFPQDPWIYRADWAYTEAAAGSTKDAPSLLGRIGYLGNRNPDLSSRNPSAARDKTDVVRAKIQLPPMSEAQLAAIRPEIRKQLRKALPDLTDAAIEQLIDNSVAAPGVAGREVRK